MMPGMSTPSAPPGAAVTVSTIVYLEDNAANLDLVKRVLESTGQYRVVGADDGLAGLELVRKERPALVLVDLDIPSINGFEVARRLRADRDPQVARTRIVAISANVLQNEPQAALEAGCDAFVEKPFDIHDFRALIGKVMARP
jgi:two-component system cell cycle response regulator DivK